MSGNEVPHAEQDAYLIFFVLSEKDLLSTNGFGVNN